MTSNAWRRSATCRAIGPCTAISWMLTGLSAGSMTVAEGIRPNVGLSEQMPLHWAGQRSDPPRSLPRPSGVMPVARAAPSPPLEPPGVRDASHGLRVAPCIALSVCQRRAKSGRLVRPIGIAPAARRCATAGASTAGTASARGTTPWVVGEPATSTFSLTVIGTPWSGPAASPLARRRSASPAAWSASSPSTRTTALTRGPTASIRSRCACTTSRLDTRFSLIAAASSTAPSPHSSVPVAPVVVLMPGSVACGVSRPRAPPRQPLLTGLPTRSAGTPAAVRARGGGAGPPPPPGGRTARRGGRRGRRRR